MRYFSTKDEIVFLVEESPERGYKARALGFSIFTEADSIPELKVNIQEAVKCHFEEDEYPLYIRLHFVKDEIIVL